MARLDKESFDKLVQIFEEAEYEPRSYSGRFMYGKDCFGVVCSNPVRMIAEVLANVARNAEDPEEVAEVAEKLMEPRQDNMGHDAIVYWPSIEWMDEEDEEDEDEDDQGVGVDTKEFESSHGRKPSGYGAWGFYPGLDQDDSSKCWFIQGDYKDALREAIQRAVDNDIETISVAT